MAKNIDIINAVINGAPQSFQDRFPLETRTSLAELGSSILQDERLQNEFLYGLVNKIAFQMITSKAYRNPLRGLIKGLVEFGDTIEEIFVSNIKAQVYSRDDAENELFKQHLPTVSAIYHKINREEVYPVTVTYAQLRRAFFVEGAMQNLVNSIIEEMTSSDEDDTFQLMKHLMFIYGTEGRFYNKTISPPADEATVRNAVVQIKAISNDMTFRKPKYNNAGVPSHSTKSEQVIFMNSLFDAQVDVELLARAFNKSLAEFEADKIVIDDFGGLENVVAILADRNWLQVWDTLNTMKSVENGLGLYTNYFRHHHQILSTSRFMPAVIFTSVAPTLVSIDVTPATANVAKKGTQQFEVVPTGTNNPPSSVTWSHDGADPKTTVSPTGLLYVGPNETTSPLTVTATSTFDELITDTAIVTVV